MLRRLTLPVAALLLAGLASPLAAQTDTPAPTRLAAVAGLAGFVDGQRPMEVSVTVTSDVLFAGILEAKVGGVTQALGVEVPAGGSKVYDMRLGPPVGNPQVRLRLISDETGDVTATTNLSLKVATDQLITTVVGPEELARRIDDSLSAITERDIVGIAIDAEHLRTDLDPARYLVLANATPLPDAARAWLGRGGRLVVAASDLGDLGLDLPVGGGNFPFGAGWVIGVEDVMALDEAQWGELITPVPYRFAPRESWQSPEVQLMQSALSGGDQRVPSLPWLLGALIAYAVLLGPVNFGILKRLGRRELAWATVPILALGGVAGFWIAGRERLQEHVVSHASVVIADGSGAQGRTASVLVVGNEGTRTLSTADGWDTVPVEAASDWNIQTAAAYATVTADGGYEFELDQLGAAGLSSRWREPGASTPEVRASTDGNRLLVDVTNTTDLNFWTWGVVARGRISLDSEPLAPATSADQAVVPGQTGFNEFGTVGDAVINQLQLWDDPFIWNRLGTLSQVAASMIEGEDAYVFGFTDELSVPLQIDGDQAQAEGTSLVIVPIDLAGLLAEDDGASLTSRLLDAENASFIDFGPGYVYIQGTEALVGWELPPATTRNPTLAVNGNFGQPPAALDMYDWNGRQFVPVAANEEIDLARFRNERGEVMLRASNGVDNFMETGISPYAFTLEW